VNPFSKSEKKSKHRKALHMLKALLCFFYANMKMKKEVNKYRVSNYLKNIGGEYNEQTGTSKKSYC
jgi:hypothetical protein